MEYLNTLLRFIWQSIGVLLGIGVLLLMVVIVVGTIQVIKERKNGRK